MFFHKINNQCFLTVTFCDSVLVFFFLTGSVESPFEQGISPNNVPYYIKWVTTFFSSVYITWGTRRRQATLFLNEVTRMENHFRMFFSMRWWRWKFIASTLEKKSYLHYKYFLITIMSTLSGCFLKYDWLTWAYCGCSLDANRDASADWLPAEALGGSWSIFHLLCVRTRSLTDWCFPLCCYTHQTDFIHPSNCVIFIYLFIHPSNSYLFLISNETLNCTVSIHLSIQLTIPCVYPAIHSTFTHIFSTLHSIHILFHASTIQNFYL